MSQVTRTALETILVGRTRSFLTLFGLSVLMDGTNPDLVDPITTALGSLGIEPLSWGTVIQDDLNRIPEGRNNQVVDTAEYRLLSTLLSESLLRVTIRVGTQSEQDWSDVAKALQKRLDSLKKDIDDAYMAGFSSLTSGKIRRNTTYRDCFPPTEVDGCCL